MKKMELLAFGAIGGSVINGFLMSQGIETMPGMWRPEVYTDAVLGLSVGAMTGISLGGAAAGTAIVAKEVVMGTIGMMRDRFNDSKEENNLKPTI